MTVRAIRDHQGISEISAEILIIILVIVISVIVFTVFSGVLNPLYTQKSVYIGGSASSLGISQPGGITDDVLTFLPKAGDPFYITGQTTGASGTQVTLNAISPSGTVLTPNGSTLSGSLYGKTLYIYPNNSPSSTQCNLAISTNPPTITLRPMTLGTWTIQMIDQKDHVIAGSYTAQVNHGDTALPVAGGFFGTGTGQFYDVNCNPITENIQGSLTSSNTGPGNMTVTQFNGDSSITVPDSTGLNFTGAMSISMWFDPTQALAYSSSGTGWEQLIGKGVTVNAGDTSSNENDNYQLFQLGNQLLFEWNDANTGAHYQAITTTTPVQANQWNYVTVTVSGTGGSVAIYYDGVSQPLTYDASNVPYGTSPIPAPSVNLESNANNLHIGEQNYASDSSDAFYFTGSMGTTSLYNRALSQQEITSDYLNDTA